MMDQASTPLTRKVLVQFPAGRHSVHLGHLKRVLRDAGVKVGTHKTQQGAKLTGTDSALVGALFFLPEGFKAMW